MLNKKLIPGAVALLASGAAGFAAATVIAQEAPSTEPAPEYRWLASHAGDYSAKVGGMLGESDGECLVESAIGGLWSVSKFEGTMMGQPYEGMEILGYDPLKEKFVSVWVDSMTPMIQALEGTYDEATGTLTMRGPSFGMDGEEGVMVNTTKYGEDGMSFAMNIEGQPGPIMTIDYTRKP